MPKIHIARTITINAPTEKVYACLNKFDSWPAWSPWQILEPEVKVKMSEDRKFYEWEGDRTGSGNMKILKEEDNKSVDYKLVFLKPWKSQADVRFELTPKNDETMVTWHMNSSLPFFMFWMKKMMEAFVSMDFDRGLAMLKDYVEDGEVHSKLDFKGIYDFSGFKFVGITTSCAIDELGDNMKADFGKLGEFLNDHQDLIADNMISIYHKWEVVKRQATYTAAIPVKSVPKDLPAGMTSGEVPDTKTYVLSHKGPYLHLGNAWSAMNTLQRSKAFKANKKIHPFERYVNHPGEAADNDLVTEVHFAVK